MRILVIKPSSLGDIFHVFPALKLLQERYPDAVFDYVVNPLYSRILDFSPVHINRKIFFERKKLSQFPGCFTEFFHLARSLRQEKYDLVVDFQGLFRSALCAALTRAVRKAGFAEPRERAAALFYSEKHHVNMQLHAVERYLRLALAVSGGGEYRVPHCELPSDCQAAEKVAALLAENGCAEGDFLVALIPGARWESKKFPPRLFAAVANLVRRKHPDWRFAVIGGKDDTGTAEEIAALAPGVIDLTGKTDLPGMVELLRRCGKVVSNDSGPVHAAAALDREIYVFFGPTDPELTGPFGHRIKVFRNEKLDCLKCLSRHCGNPECHNISPEAVAAVLAE